MPAATMNVAGFLLAALGAAVGMYGAFKQANAYYSFKKRQFLEHIYRVVRAGLVSGKSAAIDQVHAAARLGQEKGEDRTQSLLGLYCVFCGFFLQLVGAFLALIGALQGP